MNARSRDYYRKERLNHIRRKENIIKNCYWDGKSWLDSGYLGSNHGRLSKGKIHCSCWLCSFHGLLKSDMRKITKLMYDAEEYCDSNFINKIRKLSNGYNLHKYYG